MLKRLGWLYLVLIGFSTHLSSQDTLTIKYPAVAFSGVPSQVELLNSSSELPEVLIVDGEEVIIESTEENMIIRVTFQRSQPISVSGYHIVAQNPPPPVIPLWMSILPPLIAIAMALILGEVVFSLLSGIFLGGAIIGFYTDGLMGIIYGFFRIIDTYILAAMNDSGHLSVIIFSTLIGGIVAVISRNGGMQGIVNAITPYANDARSGQLATWFLGIAIFFDDYANTLVVGNTMRAITDKMRVSREKLAYIVDSTAAPVSAIAFVTTWIGAELGYISKGLETINKNSEIIGEGVYSIFLNSLAYSFYPILTLFFIFYLVYRKKEFGSMLVAERRARGGDVINQEVNTGDLTEMEDMAPVKGIEYRAYNAVIPVAIIVFGTSFGLIVTGFSSLGAELIGMNVEASSMRQIWSNMSTLDPAIDSFTTKLGTLIGAADSYISLLWSSLAALVVAIILTLSQNIMGLRETVDTTVSGFKTMVAALLILILAWALAAVVSDMHTAAFLTELMDGRVPYWLIPGLTFVLSGFVAFATGSSWSTMAIVYPLILPAAWAVCIGEGFAYDPSMSIFYNTVSAVLAGAVLGDHCSPISDTTVLSSLASGCNHIDHVRTQIPYALTVGGVALVIGTIPTALGFSSILSFILGMGLLILIIEFVGKSVNDDVATTSNKH
ncbi:MAG: Na+/H+ antiporter NhaC family protein [Saprospiraceae bacterium]|nr:Na+/H+ antiporter NhaC family protein [Saprospiraceae bacterium]